ncbi:MAG: hypothetical protein N2203_08780, partial [Bacteroidia bacterium]|nr:hypothetical protein [Bacteroidia bacterium]
MSNKLVFLFCSVCFIMYSQKQFNFSDSWDFFIKEHGQFSRRIEKIYKLKTEDSIYFGLENKNFNAYFTSDGVIFIYPERKMGYEESDELYTFNKEKEYEEEKEEIKKRKIVWHR